MDAMNHNIGFADEHKGAVTLHSADCCQSHWLAEEDTVFTCACGKTTLHGPKSRLALIEEKLDAILVLLNSAPDSEG